MRRMAALSMLVLAITGISALAQEKLDPKKLLGKWEPVDSKLTSLTLEFQDKGKWILTVEIMGKTEKAEGTYKLEGNKLEVTMVLAGQEQKEVLTVKKLTDSEFVTTDSKGKDEAFRRKK
ncbi:MAG: TIGR03066 family protein [Gemmataceae bacterium]|nr:TIGR03066 family protein [Gemmataceae bacterium]MCS7270007.1 TIGR03066 family protein [Gemmataceae bacterium]MDW8244286.1 TIGR03066 family protein [Thermogemmata sp.]